MMEHGRPMKCPAFIMKVSDIQKVGQIASSVNDFILYLSNESAVVSTYISSQEFHGWNSRFELCKRSSDFIYD